MRTGLALTVTTGIQALVSMAALTLPAIAPAVAKGVGTSPAYVGLYVALLYVAAILASLGSGTAVARLGAIRASQAGLLLCAAGLAVSSLGSLPALAAGALLIGLGYGPITPASSHLLARSTPPARMSLVFSIKQTGVPLGGVLAGAIVPPVLLWAGWQGALLAVAGACVLCALAAQPLRGELDAERDPARRLAFADLLRPMRMVLSHPALRLLAGCSFAFSISQLSLTTYLVTYLEDTLAYGLVTAGLALSVAQTGGVVGRVLWGYVADGAMGARRTLALLAFTMAAAGLATATFRAGLPLPLVLVVVGIFGASAIGWNGVYLAEVARQAPTGSASTATGGTLAFTFFGAVLGGPAFAGLSSIFGSYRAGFIGVAVAMALCGFALLRARQLGRPST